MENKWEIYEHMNVEEVARYSKGSRFILHRLIDSISRINRSIAKTYANTLSP